MKGRRGTFRPRTADGKVITVIDDAAIYGPVAVVAVKYIDSRSIGYQVGHIDTGAVVVWRSRLRDARAIAIGINEDGVLRRHFSKFDPPVKNMPKDVAERARALFNAHCADEDRWY